MHKQGTPAVLRGEAGSRKGLESAITSYCSVGTEAAGQTIKKKRPLSLDQDFML